MATLQTLRNKGGVIITVVIALALLAFILGDLMGNGNGIFSNNDEIGVIDGKTIKVQEYQQKVDEYEAFAKMNSQQMSLTEEQQNQIREQVWQQMIREVAFDKQYEKAGIDVTAEEIMDMAVGNHISQQLRSLFTNPQTGVYDRTFAQNFLVNKNSDPQAAFYWAFIEKQIKADRKDQKYFGLINKSLYCTQAQVEFEKANRSKSADINYVSVRYTLIPDSAVNVSDAEVKAIYNNRKENYKVDASRDIEYVSFPIVATDEDRAETEAFIESLKADFGADDIDAEAFAQRNAENPVPARFNNEAQLGVLAQWATTAQVGEVYGPYKEGNAYCISRLVEVAQRPDSVKASHILIRNNDKLADSLMNVATAQNFAALARQYSEDNGSAINGGELGWFRDGVMVPTFNEACFTNNKGAIVKVQSDFGQHIIYVQDKGAASKKYKVATIDKTVQYSQKTHQAVYSNANQFALDNRQAAAFNASVDTLNLVKRVGFRIPSYAQSINNIRHAREIVKWAYKAEVGEVSDLFECDDEFIVAVLVNAQEKGYANMSDVAPAIQNELRKEKKAAVVAEFAQGKSLADVAAKYNANVDSASHITYTVNSVAGAGMEPNLVGSAVAAEKGKVTAVKGNNAAYVFVKNAEQTNEVSDAALKAAYAQAYASTQYAAMRYITNVDVEDNRIKFY